MSRPTALQLQGLSFTYRDAGAPALRGVELQLQEGDVLGLIGPSGAGKTTLCSAINGVVPRLLKGTKEGEVRVLGTDVADRPVPDWADTIGMVFQDFETQIFSTEVSLEVAFGPENLGVAPEEIRTRVRETLEWAGLTHLLGRNPISLSGGEKQRLVLASVLALRPRLLVLDEPTTDLDPASKEELFQLVANLGHEGRTLLVVDHDPQLLRAAERVAVLSSGILRRETTARELREDPDWMLERGLAPDPLAEVRHRLGLPDLPDLPGKAGQELLRLGARLGPPPPRSTPGDLVMEARGVGVQFPDGTQALEDVDLEIHQGETLAIVGPNGSGKTTLARVLAGLQAPTKGFLLYRGKAMKGPREAAGRVGLVFQEPDDQIFCQTVLDEVTYAPHLAGMKSGEVSRRGADAIAAVGLTGREDEDPFALPKGDRQKVAVASVLATGPEVIVLDEPTTGLDHKDLQGMLALLRALKKQGHAIVMVTHSMGVAASEADRVVILSGGSVIADDPPRTVFADRFLIEEARLRLTPVLRICSYFDGPPALTAEELQKRCILPRKRGD